MVPSLTPTSRSALLDELEATRFDVIVAGGGITGAAVARDASARSLRVALVEADDFAAGTSSRSSKLIHGGLRYLVHGELSFIRETARERAAVHALAPHLTRPCWMVVPARNASSAAIFRTGVGIYERLGAIAEADRHQQWRGVDLRHREPRLRADRYGKALAYREYLTDDTRLVIGVLRAAVATGATVANRLPVVDLMRDGGRLDGVVARCAVTNREVRVRGSTVVNAAGPWVESLACMEQAAPTAQVHLSKGVHVVVDRERLPVNNPVLCSTADRRWIFVIPRGDVAYIGTTDTTYNGARRLWPAVGPEDVGYLLAPLADYFDIDPLRPEDVAATWSGVRALARGRGKRPEAMSRRSDVTLGPSGMVSIAGGKLTGFRLVADRVLTLIAQQLGRSLGAGPGTTPIPGAEDPAADVHGTERLTRLYGAETGDVISGGPRPVLDGHSVLEGEIDWAIDVEAALTLEDVLYRRTQVAWFLPRERERLAPAVAGHMARRLDWDAARLAQELAATRGRFADELTFRDPREVVDSGLTGLP